MVLDFRHCGFVDQRTLENTWLEAIADFKFLDRSNEFLGKGIINAGLDVKSVGANAGLTGVAVFGNNCPFDCGIQIGGVENDKRCIAAQFQRREYQRVLPMQHRTPKPQI
jgi:hypothetical protein